MQYRPLGKTGIAVSALSFGAGPVSTLMTGDDVERQLQVVAHAVERGINWFDTAASYGEGRSETNLGRALHDLQAQGQVHIATKVRIVGDPGNLVDAVRRSFEGSLERLRVSQVTLLQLHNSITAARGDEPTSLTPADVVGPGGIADAFDQLRAEGLVAHVGLTGIGQSQALREVVRSLRFETIQVPYHLLNDSAGRAIEPGFAETNYGNIIADCAQAGMGVLAIRVFAGGALLGKAPSPHTYKTPFFPLPLYERDRQRAARLQEIVGSERPLVHEALRFALAHPHVHSALVGFAATREIDEACQAIETSAEPFDWNAILAAEHNVDSPT